MNILELFATIGLKADTKKAEDFGKSIQNIKIGLGVTAVAVGAFIVTLKKLTDESMKTALALKQFKVETGASMEELQRWSTVADEVSGSGQAVADSIKAITSNQEKIKLGQGNISGYQLLGINPNQDPFAILEQLRTKTQGLSQAMKKNVMEQIGVNKELLQVLELSKVEFDSMSRNAFIIPESAVMIIDKARGSATNLTNAVKYLKAMITAGLAPSIIKVNEFIMKWIKNNQEGLVKGIKTAFFWTSKFIQAIVHTATVINNVIKGTIGWGNAFKILLGIIAVMNASLLLSPIGLFTAAIILLIAVIDDLYVYSQGGVSLFGHILDNNPKLKELFDTLKEISKAMGAFFSGDMSKFDEMIEKWGVWGEVLKGVAKTLDLITAAFSILTGNYELFSKTQQGKKYYESKSKLATAGEEDGNWGIFKEYLKQGGETGLFGMFQAMSDNKKNKAINNPKDSSKTTNINNNVNVIIEGNANASDVKNGVKDGLKEANKNIDAQMGYRE
ncbi:MAG: hypothetical protein EHM12_08265 [Dehalococcoidia bacterium]|nr:MAG: hypothetical protein EHM12_08265 [Dehalococcoidia bacterium]